MITLHRLIIALLAVLGIFLSESYAKDNDEDGGGNDERAGMTR